MLLGLRRGVRMRDRHMKQLGFHVWSVGGVSRAWRRFQKDGSYILVTDIGGYDLPDQTGPYQAMILSAADELMDLRPMISRPAKLVSWLQRLTRLEQHEATNHMNERKA